MCSPSFAFMFICNLMIVSLVSRPHPRGKGQEMQLVVATLESSIGYFSMTTHFWACKLVISSQLCIELIMNKAQGISKMSPDSGGVWKQD